MLKLKTLAIASFGFRRTPDDPNQGLIEIRTRKGPIYLTQNKEALLELGQKLTEFAQSLGAPETKN